MSTILSVAGPQNLFDIDATTLAHTADHPDNHAITILLSTPQIISSVILMSRGEQYDQNWAMRLNNTKVTLVNLEREEFVCGYVRLRDVTLAEVVMVACNSSRFLSKQIIISKSTTQNGQSLNIAELRVCYLPEPSTYESSVYFAKMYMNI